MNSSVGEKPKTYQVPKTNHPWRRYKDKIKELDEVEEKDKPVPANFITIQTFLTELVSHWADYEVTLNVTFEGSNTHFIKNLPQTKQAAWLAGILRRNYGE